MRVDILGTVPVGRDMRLSHNQHRPLIVYAIPPAMHWTEGADWLNTLNVQTEWRVRLNAVNSSPAERMVGSRVICMGVQ